MNDAVENRTGIMNYTSLPYINRELTALNGSTLVYVLIVRLGNNKTADIEYYRQDIYRALSESGFANLSDKVEEYYLSEFDLYLWVFRNSTCTIYFSDLVFLNMSCDDGFVDELYLLNESEIKDIMFRSQLLIENLFKSLYITIYTLLYSRRRY